MALRSKRHFGAAQHAPAAKPCQLVIGSHDQFTSASTIKKWVAGFNAALAEEKSEQEACHSLQLRIIESASHFWETRDARQQLTEVVSSFIIGLGNDCAHELPPGC